MGLLNKLFSKKEVQTPEPPKKETSKVVIKEQRHILENIEEHMEDIMVLVEKNDDFKLSKKELMEDGREDEKIYEYEMWEEVQLNQTKDGNIEVTIQGQPIGRIKKGSKPKFNKLIQNRTIRSIHAEVSGGNYKILKYWSSQDKYELEESENTFSITIEISYVENINETK